MDVLPNPESELLFDLRTMLRRADPAFRAEKRVRASVKREMTLLRESAFPMRTKMFDEEVATFLLLHPTGTVVQVGGGIHRRFLRLDNGSAHWVDVDHDPGTTPFAALPDSGRMQHLCSTSAMEEWIRKIRALPGPYCFVLGSRPGCFDSADIDSMVQALRGQFPGAWLVLEDASLSVAQATNEQELVNHLLHRPRASSESRAFKQVQRAGAVVDRARTLLDHLDQLSGSLPGLHRLLIRCFPGRYRSRFSDYQVLRVVLAG